MEVLLLVGRWREEALLQNGELLPTTSPSRRRRGRRKWAGPGSGSTPA